MILEILVDPTILLCVGVLLTPLFLQKCSLSRKDVLALAQSYAQEQYFLILVGVIIFSWLVGKTWRFFYLRGLAKKKKQQAENHGLHAYQLINYSYLQRPLRYGERLRARWFLWGGVFFYGYLDGLVGSLQFSSVLTPIYLTMDRRYASPIESYQGSLVHVQGFCQMFFFVPIFIILYWCFQVRHPARDGLELLISVLQCYTTVMNIGQELISGRRNLELDYFFTFSPHYIIHFWFLVVFIRSIFLVIPAFLAFFSFQRITNQVTFYQRHHYPRYAHFAQECEIKKKK